MKSLITLYLSDKIADNFSAFREHFLLLFSFTLERGLSGEPSTEVQTSLPLSHPVVSILVAAR